MGIEFDTFLYDLSMAQENLFRSFDEEGEKVIVDRSRYDSFCFYYDRAIELYNTMRKPIELTKDLEIFISFFQDVRSFVFSCFFQINAQRNISHEQYLYSMRPQFIFFHSFLQYLFQKIEKRDNLSLLLLRNPLQTDFGVIYQDVCIGEDDNLIAAYVPENGGLAVIPFFEQPLEVSIWDREKQERHCLSGLNKGITKCVAKLLTKKEQKYSFAIV